MVELLTSDFNKPKYIHTLDSGHQISSLASTDKFLIVGSVNEIIGWDWKCVTSAKLSKPTWTIKLQSQSSIEHSDVNSLWLGEEDRRMYAGCGDNNAYVLSLEDGRIISTYRGHSDFIHSVHSKYV